MVALEEYAAKTVDYRKKNKSKGGFYTTKMFKLPQLDDGYDSLSDDDIYSSGSCDDNKLPQAMQDEK